MLQLFAPWSLLKTIAPKSDLSITSLSLDVFLFYMCRSNCQTLIPFSDLLLNAFLSSSTNTLYGIILNSLVGWNFSFFMGGHFTCAFHCWSFSWLRGCSNQGGTQLHWTGELMVIQFAPREREMEMFLLCDNCSCSFCANDQLCLYRKWHLWIRLWLDGWYTVRGAEKGRVTLEINRKQNCLC